MGIGLDHLQINLCAALVRAADTGFDGVVDAPPRCDVTRSPKRIVRVIEGDAGSLPFYGAHLLFKMTSCPVLCGMERSTDLCEHRSLQRDRLRTNVGLQPLSARLGVDEVADVVQRLNLGLEGSVESA